MIPCHRRKGAEMESKESLAYEEFKNRFKLFIEQNPKVITNTLSNIFSMRIVGNKTHGDLAEIGISEFINQFMYDFKSSHVGKDLFRSKEHEEDILVKSLVGQQKGVEIPISLKAYGDGPLQLSTDKEQVFFRYLQKQGECIEKANTIKKIFASKEFSKLDSINVMPLIYDEKHKRCNIMVFDFQRAWKSVAKILFVDKGQGFDEKTGKIIPAKGRKHPIYLFIDSDNKYICEIRYGDASANALQRGFWTHTKKAFTYFDSLTNGWVDYSLNDVLVKLFSIALNASRAGHEKANDILLKDIEKIKESNGI